MLPRPPQEAGADLRLVLFRELSARDSGPNFGLRLVGVGLPHFTRRLRHAHLGAGLVGVLFALSPSANRFTEAGRLFSAAVQRANALRILGEPLSGLLRIAATLRGCAHLRPHSFSGISESVAAVGAVHQPASKASIMGDACALDVAPVGTLRHLNIQQDCWLLALRDQASQPVAAMTQLQPLGFCQVTRQAPRKRVMGLADIPDFAAIRAEQEIYFVHDPY